VRDHTLSLRCPKCGHAWVEEIYRLMRGPFRGCPYCRSELRLNEIDYGEPQSQRDLGIVAGGDEVSRRQAHALEVIIVSPPGLSRGRA
jgi:NAD-dependent SIR2 family protein deacetylase